MERPRPWSSQTTTACAAILLLLLGSVSQAWAEAEDPEDRESPVSIYFIAPFLTPWLIAYDMRREGYTSFPYETPTGYGKGERSWAVEAGEGSQFTGSGRSAQHLDLRLRTSRGLGFDAATSTYSRGSFGRQGVSGFYRGTFTANYLQSETSLLDFGMGVGVFQAPQSSWGPSWDLDYELFPKSPLHLAARYELALLGSRAYHEISFGARALYRRLALGAGYRSLLNPLRNTGGPELTARVFF